MILQPQTETTLCNDIHTLRGSIKYACTCIHHVHVWHILHVRVYTCTCNQGLSGSCQICSHTLNDYTHTLYRFSIPWFLRLLVGACHDVASIEHIYEYNMYITT